MQNWDGTPKKGVIKCDSISTIWSGYSLFLWALITLGNEVLFQKQNGKGSQKVFQLLNAMHYRAIRIAVKDRHQSVSRSTLDEVGRCRPSTWGKYAFISSTVKIIQRQEPVSLFARMMANSYTTRRRSNRFRFHDTSMHKIGRMMLKNRLTLLNEFDCEWLTFSEDKLRIELKKCLKMTTQASGGFSPG